MTKYIPPVRRIDRPKTHWYEDGDGKRIPGVTTILGAGIPKPKLINWAANTVAESAVNRWDEFADMPAAARLKALKDARYETSNIAKNKGTQVHSYAERLVQGERVEGIPDELRPYTENYVRFIDQWQLDPILVEVVIVNYTIGYAGTLDLIAELTTPAGMREIWLLDIKTGEKGIFPETALQLAAYRYSEFYVDDDGNEQPMVPVQACGAIHVTADDAILVPTLSGPDELKMFRIAQKVYEYDRDSDRLVLPPMQHPTPSAARLIWENT